jgi:hypothetical protein
LVLVAFRWSVVVHFCGRKRDRERGMASQTVGLVGQRHGPVRRSGMAKSEGEAVLNRAQQSAGQGRAGHVRANIHLYQHKPVT